MVIFERISVEAMIYIVLRATLQNNISNEHLDLETFYGFSASVHGNKREINFSIYSELDFFSTFLSNEQRFEM